MQTDFFPITITPPPPPPLGKMMICSLFVKLIPLFKNANLIYFVVKEFKIFFSRKSTKFGVLQQTKFPELSKSVYRKLFQIYYKQQNYKCYFGYHGNKTSIATSHRMNYSASKDLCGKKGVDIPLNSKVISTCLCYHGNKGS